MGKLPFEQQIPTLVATKVTEGWSTILSEPQLGGKTQAESLRGSVIHSPVHVGYHTVCDFLKRYGMHLAGRPKGLHFNMAVCEEFDFVVSAWASESHHDGVTVALKVELNSTIPQP
jgi:hypothetical protein